MIPTELATPTGPSRQQAGVAMRVLAHRLTAGKVTPGGDGWIEIATDGLERSELHWLMQGLVDREYSSGGERVLITGRLLTMRIRIFTTTSLFRMAKELDTSRVT